MSFKLQISAQSEQSRTMPKILAKNKQKKRKRRQGKGRKDGGARKIHLNYSAILVSFRDLL